MRIERFEDVNAWQEARTLTVSIYEASDSGPFARDFGLRDQIREAAGSTMHDIAEGFDAGSDAGFIRFLKYSRQLYIAIDQDYIDQDQFQCIYDQATSVKKLINAFIGYLRS